MAVQLVQAVVVKEPLYNMNKSIIFMAIFLVSTNGFGQSSIDDVLKKYNDHSVPYIYVEELIDLKTPTIILDTREASEYEVSHLENAITVGFDDFEISKIETLGIQKNSTIVLYCSVGVRSEIIGKQLLAAGYTTVYNLYGGIFEWINSDKKVYNAKQEQTLKVHAFSKKWGKYLLKGIKIYE